jgi:ABC-type bacteriocin/lantibiotic exporter with double-glycine peptidase domain
VGAKILVLAVVICASVLFEGLGISLMLPIIEGNEGNEGNEGETEITQMVRSAFAVAGVTYNLGNLLVIFVLVFAARNLFMVFQASFTSWITTRLLVRLRYDVCRDVLNADYRYLLRQNIGYLTNIVVGEIKAIPFAVQGYANMMVAVAFSVMYIAVPFWLNPLLSASIVLVGVPSYFLMQRLNVAIRAYSAEQTVHAGDLQSLLGQTFGFFKYLKATQSHQSLLQRIHEKSDALGRTQYKGSVLGAIAQNAFEPVGVVVLALLLYYEVAIMGKQILEVGFVIYLLRRALASVLTLQQHYTKLCGAAGGIDIYLKITGELRELQDLNTVDGLLTPDLGLPIRFQDVHFEYVPESPVLKGISFAIMPLKTTAFVGASGVGKTTIADLITGVLSPTRGKISVGESDYAQTDLAALRRKVGYITQEDVIFNDSIANNITLWDNTRIANMEESAQLAGIGPFIEAAPEGYASLLGDRGIMVSGGQRQRLMIARELCKDSDILILDEATSALDSDTEEQIKSNIDSLQGHKTIVVIAHRLATVRSADMLYVLRDGHVVEQGGYDELRTQGGEFSRLLAQQGIEATASIHGTA